jgi:class 3 adenylate cyclase
MEARFGTIDPLRFIAGAGLSAADEPRDTLKRTSRDQSSALFLTLSSLALCYPRCPQRSDARVEAERRQVTVLFADMVGFTSFSERSGEEGAYTLMRSLSKLMDKAVREQGGVVQSFTGDGIMAVFGAPVAFEDAPLRACRAALSILQWLKAAGPDLEAKHGVRPQLRIGLDTGAAVVGVPGKRPGAGNGPGRHSELRVTSMRMRRRGVK